MQEELPKAFSPQEIESKLLDFWAKHQFFTASAHSTKPTYTICIPPPNVTGHLHMGHALVNTIQDVLCRFKRMQGFEVLWMPGTDHAGIATQTVVERRLIELENKRRVDYPREEFLEKVWDWKEKSEQVILGQLKRLGSSCDWSRQAFTMDEKRCHAVKAAFKKLFDDGLIYRGDYLVNWDPVTQTALADDEVEYEEKDGFLYYIRYPFADDSAFLTIATTRPETLLGDTAVAVNPSDNRYAHLIGKKLQVPFVNRTIPIIADNFVDPEFGTGAVKITPAHDTNDYQMALRHNLPMINLLTPEAYLNENGGPFQGLRVEAAREAIVLELEKLNLLQKKQPHLRRVGISYRSKAIIEPYLSKQWFINMAPFKEKLISAVRDKKVKLIPTSWENTYYHWIENLRDWCISRQLWWGHQIPIWYDKENPAHMICYAGDGLPPEVKKHPDRYIQDPDVLDTWFSSSLWPFATLGWPDKTPDLAAFYPNATLVTGHDILFFWVARMIMMGEYFLGEVPFPETFLHGLIYGKTYWKVHHDGSISYITGAERLEYDLGKPTPAGIFSKWEKMSKSKGNIIDPLDMIDMYGADALRIALCASATQARQIDLDRRRFEEYKNFANKVWNGARFVLMHLVTFSPSEPLASAKLEDTWIIHRFNQAVRETTASLENYALDKAAHTAYTFFWDDFCSYYVEMAKPFLFGKMGTEADKARKKSTLFTILLGSIRLLHPMAPFLTEEIFQILKAQFPLGPKPHDPLLAEALDALINQACCIAPYPQIFPIPHNPEQEFAFVQQIVHAIRNIRGQMQIPPQVYIDVHLQTHNKEQHDFLTSTLHIIRSLTNIRSVHFDTNTSDLFGATDIVQELKIFIPLPEEEKEKELKRLQKEEIKLGAQINTLTTTLSSPDFLTKAPPALVDKQQQALSDAENKLKEVMEKIKKLS